RPQPPWSWTSGTWYCRAPKTPRTPDAPSITSAAMVARKFQKFSGMTLTDPVDLILWIRRPPPVARRQPVSTYTHRTAALRLGCGLAKSLAAQTTFTETEPNDTHAQANGPFLMASGDMITGTSTGQATTGGALNTMDWYIAQPVTAPLGIYRHTM